MKKLVLTMMTILSLNSFAGEICAVKYAGTSEQVGRIHMDEGRFEIVDTWGMGEFMKNIKSGNCFFGIDKEDEKIYSNCEEARTSFSGKKAAEDLKGFIEEYLDREYEVVCI
ncbi:MAG: hypothetical protein H6621_01270 [Halobacteriovoraceae bacterium]|nr:hypothetical protein [Halobacteriovoraceae bacterium]MCB9093673.1 hypothetical protein [Halobacteriovoraceae bacterium]